MFNFKVMNKAVYDVELSGSAFKLLYLIANKCSAINEDSVEIHNGFFMGKLGLSEKQIQRLTNELVERKYINKEIVGTSKNRKGNIYTIITDKNDDKFDDKNVDKNVALKNNIKINKNITKEKIYKYNNSNISKKEIDDRENNVMIESTIEEYNNNISIDIPESDNDDNSNIDNSSTDFSNDVPNIEYRHNDVSGNNPIEENKSNNPIEIITSIETNDFPTEQISIQSNFDINPPKNAPHSEANENKNEINNDNMTELEVCKFLGDAVIGSVKLMRATKSYDNGFDNLKKAFIQLEEKGWQRNDNVVRKYISMFDYAIEEDMKELENSSKNDFKAVPDASNGSDNKSINEENKTCQEANKRA